MGIFFHNLGNYKVISYGLGAIGTAAAQVVWQREDMELVGAVDVDREKVGRDFGELLGTERMGKKVRSSLAEVLEDYSADVAIHTTGSQLERVVPQLEEILLSGLNVISSCEELLFPWLKNPQLAEHLHRLAIAKGVSVVAMGVNPGLVMDRLPAFLARSCIGIRRIEVKRIVDVTTRRLQLQEKVGLGLTQEEFQVGVDAGRIGHVGLTESAAFLAHTCQLAVDHIGESIEPILADESCGGQVLGLRQVASGCAGEEELVRLELQMSAEAPDPRDEIHIDAKPPIHVVVPGGIAGDEATAALLVNAVPLVVSAPSGLLLDLPMTFLSPFSKGEL